MYFDHKVGSNELWCCAYFKSDTVNQNNTSKQAWMIFELYTEQTKNISIAIQDISVY